MDLQVRGVSSHSLNSVLKVYCTCNVTPDRHDIDASLLCVKKSSGSLRITMLKVLLCYHP